jgi:hypothetical protein
MMVRPGMGSARLARRLQEQDAADDVADLADPPERGKLGPERGIALGRMGRHRAVPDHDR